MFSAAANGGAYSTHYTAALARLRCWQAIEALCGFYGEVNSVYEYACKCTWFGFYATGKSWWYHVSGDIGIACLTPDGMNMAVLASTDTD